MPKTACMTRQTLLMFPTMRRLEESSLRAASKIAEGGDPHAQGFKVIGRGAFTKAYSNGVYVVKGERAENAHCDNTAAWNYRTWFRNTYKARHTSKVFAKACKNLLAPTVVLFDCVVIQERVKYIGNKFSMELCFAVEDVANLLGITDMHGANWGVTSAGKVKMFDIMPSPRFPKGRPFTRDLELEQAILRMETLLAEELRRAGQARRLSFNEKG
jgi:hypothetical protein